MKGMFYRLGVRIKEFGERKNIGCLIRLGLSIRNYMANI